MYAIGTSENISPSFSKPITGDDLCKNNLCTYDHAVKGLYTTCAFSLTGGNLLKWFRDEWGNKEVKEAQRTQKDAYDLLIQKIEKKPSPLIVLPYMPEYSRYFWNRRHNKGARLMRELSARAMRATA